MIKVKLKYNNNVLDEIIIKGHALYDDFGKDIVCASVSSTVITSVNAAILIDNDSISYDDSDGVVIFLKKKDDITMKIINNMISNLKELEKVYPKNIEIKEENNDKINAI